MSNNIRILQWNMGGVGLHNAPSQEGRVKADILTELIQNKNPSIITLQEVPFEIRKILSLGYELDNNGPQSLAIFIKKNVFRLKKSFQINTRSHGILASLVAHPSTKFLALTYLTHYHQSLNLSLISLYVFFLENAGYHFQLVI